MKAIRTLRIIVDSAEDKNGILRPVYAHIKLYREDDGLIWRADGPDGDPVEVLPRPASVAQAEADARALYPAGSAWNPSASWF